MPLVAATQLDREFMRLALAEARKSYDQGGIPVGAVMARGGKLFAVGHNRSRQTNDPTSHGETDCIRNAGLQDNYADVTLYTTLSPCMMCAGAMLFLGVPRVVVAERDSYRGDLDFLMARGMTVSLLDDPECVALMRRFIAENQDLWRRIGTAGRLD
jgi:cytosine deaminase